MTTTTSDAPAKGQDTQPDETPPVEPEQPTTDDVAPERDDTDWKAQSRTWEDRSKAHKKAAERATAAQAAADAKLAAVLKAAGLAPDDDPAKAAEKAALERDALAADNRTLRLERAAEKAGRKAGADVDALLDSRGFADALAKLDPAADDFTERLTQAVTAALDANPRLKATPPAPTRSVPDPSGAHGTATRDVEPGMDRMRAAYAAAPTTR